MVYQPALAMPCTGSDGLGATMSFTIVETVAF